MVNFDLAIVMDGDSDPNNLIKSLCLIHITTCSKFVSNWYLEQEADSM